MKQTGGYTDENNDYIFNLMISYRNKYKAVKTLNKQLLDSMSGFIENTPRIEDNKLREAWSEGHEIGCRLEKERNNKSNKII